MASVRQQKPELHSATPTFCSMRPHRTRPDNTDPPKDTPKESPTECTSSGSTTSTTSMSVAAGVCCSITLYVMLPLVLHKQH